MTGTYSNIFGHLTSQLFPECIQIGSPLTIVGILDVFEKNRRFSPVSWDPVHKFSAWLLEIVLFFRKLQFISVCKLRKKHAICWTTYIYKLSNLLFRWLIVMLGHKLTKRIQCRLRRLLHFHIDKCFRIIVQFGHLHRVQEITTTVNFTETRTKRNQINAPSMYSITTEIDWFRPVWIIWKVDVYSKSPRFLC